MAEMMSPKGEAQCARKGHHLRRNHGVRSRARNHNHAGIVDDTTRAAPVIEAYRLEQEVFRFKAGEAWGVLEEQPARVGQGERGTLRTHHLAGENHTVRRSVVLHLLTRPVVVLPRALDRKSTRLDSSHLGISY